MIRGKKRRSDEADDEEMERQPRKPAGLCESFMGKGKEAKRDQPNGASRHWPASARSITRQSKTKDRKCDETLAHPMRSGEDQYSHSKRRHYSSLIQN